MGIVQRRCQTLQQTLVWKHVYGKVSLRAQGVVDADGSKTIHFCHAMHTTLGCAGRGDGTHPFVRPGRADLVEYDVEHGRTGSRRRVHEYRGPAVVPVEEPPRVLQAGNIHAPAVVVDG